MPFHEKGNVRIRYEEVGSGFPLLVTPGGGLNSRVSNWPTAVFNAMEAFKNDFRCITMDQRNANGGESTGPIPAGDPWGAFADDQLGLMDHLGIQSSSTRATASVGVFASSSSSEPPINRCRGAVPAGRAPSGESRRHVQLRPRRLGPRLRGRRPENHHGEHRGLPAQPLPSSARLCVQRFAPTSCRYLPDADARDARRHAGASVLRRPWTSPTRTEGPVDGVSLERAEGPAREDD